MPFPWIHISERVYRIATVLYLILLFILSSIPTLPLPRIIQYEDLVLHASAYGVLYMLARRGFPRASSWTILLFVFLYGLSDEIHQWFVPGRVCDPLDFVADCAGGTIAMVISRYTEGRARSRDPEDA